MNVREITLKNFLNHVGTTVALPERGVVVITGQNGSGKSALLEGVSFAAWGQTLRGTTPITPGQEGHAWVGSFDTVFKRSWTKAGKKSLNVQLIDFESNTKAQEHVNSVQGNWDIWRKSCTFSLSDPVTFSTASDAERKILLETMLGLDQFDVAFDRAKASHAEAVKVVQATDRQLFGKESERRGLSSSYDALVKSKPATINLTTEDYGLRILKQACVEARNTLEIESARYEADLSACSTARAHYITAKNAVTALVGADTCVACSRPFDNAADVQAARNIAKQAFDALVVPQAPDSTARNKAAAALKAAEDALAQARQAKQLNVALIEAEARRASELANLRTKIDELTATIDDLGDAKALAQISATELEHVRTVLSTRGVRAHLLETALTSIEASANVWLERIARVDRPLSLRLTSTVDKKSGGTLDVLGMHIEGAGGGHGYWAASGGERRRIDIALMIALAEVSQVLHRRTASTMWFDEVFDTLDHAGVQAVAAALSELAQDRCVVVISHNRELSDALPHAVRLHVDNGQLCPR